MSSILRAQKANAAKAEAKSNLKRKADGMDVDDDAPVQPKKKNKQRVLLLSSRGVTHRMRHLMSDLEALLPHTKKGVSPCQIMSFGKIFTACLVHRIQVGFEIPVASPPGVGGS